MKLNVTERGEAEDLDVSVPPVDVAGALPRPGRGQLAEAVRLQGAAARPADRGESSHARRMLRALEEEAAGEGQREAARRGAQSSSR